MPPAKIDSLADDVKPLGLLEQISGLTARVEELLIQSNKNGFMYVLDRTNCTAHPYTRVNWASGIDLTTGRPLLTGTYKDFLACGEVEVFPSRGSNAVPSIQSDQGIGVCGAVGCAAYPTARAAQAAGDR
jgi:hypothetical protein